jgi:hypothetical protein
MRTKRVAGIIAEHEQDLQLAYAAAAVPGLTILTYNVEFCARTRQATGSR